MGLTGKRVVLRPARLDDVEARYRWYANPTVTLYLPLAGKGSLPRADIATYLSQVSASDRPVLDFSIDLQGSRPIGACSLRDFDNGGRAEISLVIGEPSAWGHGYGREAMQLLLDHGFADLGLHAIWLVVRADNQRAVRLYRSLGFRVDDTRRAAALVDGVYHDKLVMSLRRDEWAADR